MVGIVDPNLVWLTSTSGAISLWRGDWLSAGISFLGVFAGLAATWRKQVGKLPKYAKSIEKAIELARQRPRLIAKEIAPHLKDAKRRYCAEYLWTKCRQT